MKRMHISLLGFISMAIAGCWSSAMLDKEYRTNHLREVYPPVTTSRKDVHAELKSVPVFSLSRPSEGWESHENSYFAQKIQKLESVSIKEIQLVEKFIVSDPRNSLDFLSLAQIWFYYDDGQKIVDVEWAYQSD